MAQIATLVFLAGILLLFKLDGEKVRVSKALWIPLLWIMIGGSRNVGEWLSLGSPTDQNEAYLEGNPIDRNVLGAFEAIAIITLVQRRKRVGALLRANGPILMYFGYCLMSTMWADYPLVGAKRWIRASGDFLMVLVVLSDPNWFAAVKRFFARAGFVLMPLSILFIRYYPDLGRAYGVSDGTMYWTGVSTGKNGLGVICQVFGVASVWRICMALRDREDPDRKKRLLAHGVLLLMAMYLLYEANSMTSICCFLLASGVVIATNLKMVMRRPALVHLMVAGAIFASFSTLFLNMGGAALKTMGRDPTLTGRTDVWQMVLPFAANPIFGAGYESFWLGDRLLAIHRINHGINQAHNGYIEVYLNLGWVGVSLILLIIATSYRRIMTGFRRDPDAGRLRLGYFLVGVIYSFTEAGIKMMHPIWISFLLVSAIVPSLLSTQSQALTAGAAPVRAALPEEEVSIWKEAV